MSHGRTQMGWRFFGGLRRARAGFTLVELLIVVAIIGILLAITMVSLMRIREVARNNIAYADLRMIGDAASRLMFDTGKWPGGIPVGSSDPQKCWDLDTPAAGLRSADSNFQHWKGPYIKQVPVDPWGRKYFFDANFHVAGTGYPVVASMGPKHMLSKSDDADAIYVIVR